MIQLKYAPWRSSLEHASMARYNTKRPIPTTSSVPQGAKLLAQVLAQTANRHSGGVCVVLHFGVLVAKPVGSRSLGFGADTENASDVGGVATSNMIWQVASVGALRCQTLEKPGRFILAWEALAPSLAKAPRTCQEWVRQMDIAMSELRRLRLSAPRLPPPAPSWKAKYTTHWAVRACMLLRMHQHQFRRLQVGDISLRAFCRMCPDEHDNLHRICLAHKEVHCASDLLGLCHAQRPELCSKVACLASDLGFDVVDVLSCSM